MRLNRYTKKELSHICCAMYGMKLGATFSPILAEENRETASTVVDARVSADIVDGKLILFYIFAFWYSFFAGDKTPNAM